MVRATCLIVSDNCYDPKQPSWEKWHNVKRSKGKQASRYRHTVTNRKHVDIGFAADIGFATLIQPWLSNWVSNTSFHTDLANSFRTINTQKTKAES